MSILFSLIKDIFTRGPSPEEMRTANVFATSVEKQDELESARNHYQHILAINPNDVDALFNLGIVLDAQGRNEAIDCFRKILGIAPHHPGANIQLLFQLQLQCIWAGIDTITREVRQIVLDKTMAGKNYLIPFNLLTLPGITAREQKICAEKFAQAEFPQQAVTSLRKQLNFTFNRPSHEKIRIGYLSSDFNLHPVAFQMVEIFEKHNRSKFHVIAYSYGQDDRSAIRLRLEKTFDRFVDIRDMSLETAAQAIHNDRVDILVDLSGYTKNTRSGILALRPAPIQVNYLGYPGTMGADFVDYLIADRFIIPPEQQQYYSEQVVRMPDCYMPNDSTRVRLPAPTRGEAGLPEGAFVFCCFNQTYKITPDVYDIWCRLLKTVSGSVIWLAETTPQVASNLRREAEARGIAADRIIMARKLPSMDKHLARLQCADLFLDTLPYNAHTTCSDALWMGLPVVTCAGDTFPSRVAGSLLTAIGVPELITYNLDDYYQLALELATDKDRLAAIRNKIRDNRDTSPLFDSERFTRNLEQLYMQMVTAYSAGTAAS